MHEAALLTRCYTQQALRPLIDSEINHKRHFIKIPFINKGIDVLDLLSIFQDKSVTSYTPDYSKILSRLLVLIRIIFDFNKLVSDLDIDANASDS